MTPIQPSQPRVQSRIIHPYHLLITLEQRIIRYIEPHQRRIQPYISFSDVFAKEIWMVAFLVEEILEPVEGLEEFGDVLVIGCLGGCKPDFVDAVVDCVVDPCIEVFDFTSKMCRDECGWTLL